VAELAGHGEDAEDEGEDDQWALGDDQQLAQGVAGNWRLAGPRGDQHDRGGDQGRNGAALVGLVADEPAQPGDPLGVQAVGGLVEQQDLGVAEQRRGQPEALARAEREAADPPAGGLLRRSAWRCRRAGRRPSG
jgi:hypothetical protein